MQEPKHPYSVRLDPALHTAFKTWAIASRQTLEVAIAAAMYKAMPPAYREKVTKP